MQIEGWVGWSVRICTLCKLEKPYTKMDGPLVCTRNSVVLPFVYQFHSISPRFPHSSPRWAHRPHGVPTRPHRGRGNPTLASPTPLSLVNSGVRWFHSLFSLVPAVGSQWAHSSINWSTTLIQVDLCSSSCSENLCHFKTHL